MTLEFLHLADARDLLADKKISATELTQYYLDVIEQTEDQLHAFVTVTEKEALEEARKSDERRAKGESLGPLDGIPGALKDVITTAGVPTTASSRILESFVPPYSAHVATLLKQAGMIMLGKTNLDEFAMGTTTEYSAFSPTTNPWNSEHVAGGSSGGSAAAVAADQCLIALGTDTGGSIRLPAAWTGVVGLRPTYGRVSRNGVIAMASSLDQVGTFTRSVSDAAELLEVIASPDPWDSTSVNRPVPRYAESLRRDVKGMRIGVIKEYFSQAIDSHIQKSVKEAIATLERLGAEVKEVSLPLSKVALAVYCILVPAEVSTNLERFDGIRYGLSAAKKEDRLSLVDVYTLSRQEGFGSEAKRRSMLGAYVLSEGYYEAYYHKAQVVRGLIQRQFSEAFAEVDCLVGPVSPTNAFRIGENANDPLKTWMADLLAVPVNIAGLPGLSVPCGSENGLPIGLQIIANHFREEDMISVASAFEVSTDWHKHHPKIAKTRSGGSRG